MPERDPSRVTEKPRAPRDWSGPIEGQQVMGVHDLGDEGTYHPDIPHKTYESDPHGFVFESYGMGGRPPADRAHGPQTAPGKVSLLGNAAHRLYDTHGGSWSERFEDIYRPHAENAGYSSPTQYAKDEFGADDAYIAKHNETHRRVVQHWRSQPLEHVRTDTPIHTGQNVVDTEFGSMGMSHWANEEQPHGIEPEGRRRIQAIQGDVEAGNPIRKPAWLVRKGGRLFALDGHHRIVAAREAGLSRYPARVWDWDAENS